MTWVANTVATCSHRPGSRQRSTADRNKKKPASAGFFCVGPATARSWRPTFGAAPASTACIRSDCCRLLVDDIGVGSRADRTLVVVRRHVVGVLVRFGGL